MGAGDWTCTVTGDVASATKQDNDKSGRNPKWVHELVLNVVSVDGLPPGIHLRPETRFRVTAADLDKMKATVPPIGAHVTVTARGNGPSTDLLYITGLRSEV